MVVNNYSLIIRNVSVLERNGRLVTTGRESHLDLYPAAHKIFNLEVDCLPLVKRVTELYKKSYSQTHLSNLGRVLFVNTKVHIDFKCRSKWLFETVIFPKCVVLWFFHQQVFKVCVIIATALAIKSTTVISCESLFNVVVYYHYSNLKKILCHFINALFSRVEK